MELRKGDIVLSLCGRDKGHALFVADLDEGYAILVDGKGRRLEQPKRKKQKHCKFLDRDASRVSEKFSIGERVTNQDVRRALAAYRAGATTQSDDDKTGGG